MRSGLFLATMLAASSLAAAETPLTHLYLINLISSRSYQLIIASLPLSGGL